MEATETMTPEIALHEGRCPACYDEASSDDARLNGCCSEACYRRRREGGTCRTCGRATSVNSQGDGLAARHCYRCSGAATRAWVIRSIQDWYRLYGESPGASEWNLAAARRNVRPKRLRLLEQRHEEYEWPSTSTVRNHFGTWAAAREAAGVPPRGRLAKGRKVPSRALTKEQEQEIVAAWPGKTYDELVELYGVSRGTIWRTLRAARTEQDTADLRARYKSAAVACDEGERVVGLSFTDEEVREIREKYPTFTYRQLAEEYGTSHQTIARIVKGSKKATVST